MDILTVVSICLACSVILYAFYKRITRRILLSEVPGPEPGSFWLGNLPQVLQSEVGEVDWRWQEQFGGIVHMKGSFGDDRLWVSDPKALQYIYQTSGYNFPKQPERRVLSRLLSGEGILWADGEVHKRHRKAMLPAFGQAEARALVPIFNRCAAAITQKWRDRLLDTPEGSVDLNVALWLSSAALDAIGEAGFDYKFGCLDDLDNDLLRGYRKLMTQGAPPPSDGRILFLEISHYIPMWILDFIYDHFPSPSLQVLRDHRVVARKVAQELIDAQSDTDPAETNGNKDVMSILIRANKSLNEKMRLTDDEIIDQMRVILLAGHETTGNTLAWALMELAKNPSIQNRLRSEVHSMQAAIHARGDRELTASDFESMPYTTAVVKEVLRMYPASFHQHRQAANNDVLPVSKPITLKSGRIVSEIPIPRGTKVLLSVTAYNRNKDVWGEDAHVFNPDRWLDDDTTKRATNAGVYSNLLTFAGGVRGCIGWRFALNELHAFLAELVANFEFARTPELDRLHKVACLAMTPNLDGDLSKGAQMPLRVSLASRE
ncbi:unnamed protein product [Somion occarium]|uniref:Cytochrome P450 n=1 Tax=Somion occarium TaxID=3059160 RepID=A0ABP1DXD4_9APHY